MDCVGQYYLDYWYGEHDTSFRVQRDDGYYYQSSIPVQDYFNSECESNIDRSILTNSISPILDIGAGAGKYSLLLQNLNFEVTAIDISAGAVEVMKNRGIKDVRQLDFRTLFQANDSYRTILLLDMGITGTCKGVREFLREVKGILAPGGYILTTSYDNREQSNDESYELYKQKNIQMGQYFGERKIRIAYKNNYTDWFDYVQIDPVKLSEICEQAGFSFEIVAKEGNQFLAKIQPL